MFCQRCEARKNPDNLNGYGLCAPCMREVRERFEEALDLPESHPGFLRGETSAEVRQLRIIAECRAAIRRFEADRKLRSVRWNIHHGLTRQEVMRLLHVAEEDLAHIRAMRVEALDRAA